jgi:hypothetical protein
LTDFQQSIRELFPLITICHHSRKIFYRHALMVGEAR